MTEDLKKTTTSIDNLNREITERKKVEEALRELEAKWRSLVENAPNIIMTVNRDGIILFINRNPPGISLEEPIGRNIYDFIQPEYHNVAMETIERVFQTEKAGAYESVISEPRGHIWYETQVRPVKCNGRVVAVTLIATDITQRKKTEEKIRRRAEEWTSTFDSITDLVSIQSRDFKFVMVNKAFADVFRLKPNELIGKFCYEVIHGTKESWSTCPHKQVLETGKPTVEEFFEPKLGIYLQVSTSPIFNDNGEITGTVHIAKDITAPKKIEEELQQSEQRFRAIFDNAADGILLADVENRRFYSGNKMICQMLGYTAEEIENLGVMDIHPKEDLPYVTEQFERQTRGEFTLAKDIPVKRKDGSIFYADINSFPITFGEKTYLMGIFRDISDHKKAKQTLEELNKDLESAIQELNRSNKELKDFAHVIAHDLKAPLRAIGTLADWISTDYSNKFDEHGKKQIKLLIDRVKRMSELIDGILRYSEIGRVTHKKEKVNLNTLITETIVQITPPENIEIIIENKLPFVICEKTHLMQIFQNLLSNAVKYMDKSQGRVRIGCVEEDDFWKFNVADNGPGIAEEYFEKIFQIFQTLSPRDGFESTGIGLAVAKKIVESYGGQIWVESKLGEGSTFFFTLPKQEGSRKAGPEMGG